MGSHVGKPSWMWNTKRPIWLHVKNFFVYKKFIDCPLHLTKSTVDLIWPSRRIVSTVKLRILQDLKLKMILSPWKHIYLCNYANLHDKRGIQVVNGLYSSLSLRRRKAMLQGIFFFFKRCLLLRASVWDLRYSRVSLATIFQTCNRNSVIALFLHCTTNKTLLHANQKWFFRSAENPIIITYIFWRLWT
jgi:hypothetical protein